MGIDVGTSACKVAVFDIDGKVVSQVAKDYPVYHPVPGWVEQDPNEWWESVCYAIREAIHTTKIDASEIAGVGVDVQSWSAIPIDENGCVLHNTPIWMDTIASKICSRVIEKIGFDRIFNISGNSFEPTYSTPKILWFKENKPYEAEKGKKRGKSTFQIMDEEAGTVSPGSDGLIFLPYMAGERSPLWDKNAVGVFLGLSYSKGRAHMIRSILEGCAYSLYHNLKTAEEAGVKVDTLNAIGGAANSRL